MQTFGKCPQCGKGELIQGTIGYLCNYCKSVEDSCKFIIFREYFGKEMTPAIVKELLTNGKTQIFKDLKKKDGGTFAAALMLEDGKVKPSFDTTYLDGVACPKCGGKIIETGKGFSCENYHAEKPCNVYISRETAGVTISKKTAIEILSGAKTDFFLFTAKTGKKFSARLVFDKEFKLAFDYAICKCPQCGNGDIYGGDKAYGCSNYAAENKCSFTIWREIYGKTITIDIVTELCANKETKIMKGFKTQKSEAIERKLVITPEFKVIII